VVSPDIKTGMIIHRNIVEKPAAPVHASELKTAVNFDQYIFPLHNYNDLSL
jgi:hypothetical protein